MPKRYWLLKSEPEAFSIQDLAQAKGQTTCWDGVRNYQARNFMREIRLGDQAFFYHSNAAPPCIVGSVEIVKQAYPDPTQFDPKDHHYDPKSKMDSPAWDMVDVKLVEIFPRALGLDELREVPELEGMELLRRGSRLSVQPVSPEQWKVIVKLAKRKK
ncbi:MAG: EVE domain-containing protein [Acidobacteria bacterium]|nr:EVE domain-containing protein [Acidobacteriota bacterium]MBI3425959.1 EVE domain-containing protein [Acidobacteriota bacterium]